MNKQLSTEDAGRLLQNNVERADEFEYKVKSASSNEIYQIIYTELGRICSCSNSMYRRVQCKFTTLWIKLSFGAVFSVEEKNVT